MHVPPCLVNCVFLVDMGFLHVDPSCLELPISGDLPTLASQSAGIIGVSRHTQPTLISLFGVLCYQIPTNKSIVKITKIVTYKLHMYISSLPLLPASTKFWTGMSHKKQYVEFVFKPGASKFSPTLL